MGTPPLKVGSASAAETDHDDTAHRISEGLVAGAGVDVLFVLAVRAIPCAGLFVIAGFLVHALGITGGAIASGTQVGATSGAVAGAFTKAGYDEHEAQYYGAVVEGGATIVAIDTVVGGVPAAQVRDILTQYGAWTVGVTA